MILNFLAIIAASYILSNQILPLEQFKQYLNNYFNKRVISQKKWFKILKQYTSHLFNCASCISFWLTIFILGSFPAALIAYVLTGVLTRNLNSTSI